MRAKRETTYGVPARILANADRVRTMQDAHDHGAAQAAGTAAHPRPRWPRPVAERAVRMRSQGAAHAQR